MKSVSKQFMLTHPGGEDIYLFTLVNGSTQVCITNYGAIITQFKIRMADGTMNDIVLGFEDISEYWSPAYLAQHPWFGCIVGRYANRIKNAQFMLDGKTYELTRNNGKEQLHGGINGFDKKIWEFVGSGDDPIPFIALRYLSKDGEEGFPGNVETIVRYELSDTNHFSYSCTATTDAPTPLNLTQHSYFNLHNGEGSIHDNILKIPASNILEQENNLVVTGNQLPVENTAWDFRKAKLIGDGLKLVPEFDQTFVLDQPALREPVEVAQASCPRNGTILTLLSTESVVHFYSGKWIPPVMGKRNTLYKPFSGFCLETHKHPNAVNIPSFPDSILRPGEQYYQKTIYQIESSG